VSAAGAGSGTAPGMAGGSAAEIARQRLAKARLLVSSLEAGRESEANALAREVAGMRDLGEELGRITRELHDALAELRVDPRISELAANEIPDAREKLSWVLTLTEQAAHTVINAVEEGLPLASRLAAHDTADEPLRADAQRLHQLLSDILMAQSFQDLTGQAIRRVIEVSGELEKQLALLLHRSGARAGEPPAAKGVAPGAEKMRGQDEVDDLLSGLGF